MIVDQAARLNFGFASNMTFLLWCVCGGLLLHMFESTFFSMLIKPVYEKPINSAEDVLDRNLTVLFFPGTEALLEIMKNSSYSTQRELAERTIVPKVIFFKFVSFILKKKLWKDGNEYVKMVQERVLASGSSVLEIAYLLQYELDWAKYYGTRWYRSRERKGATSPYASWLMNKKWTLEEEFNNHMMMFQQVTVSSRHLSKLHFDIPGWIDDR